MSEIDKWSRKDFADILFKKYSLLKAEVHLHMGNFKRHSKHVQLVSTALFAGISYIIVEGPLKPSDSNIFIWATGLLLATCLLCYYVYDTLDSLYDINILGERMIVLENQINEAANRKLLIWETEVSAQVHSEKPFPGVLPPFVLVQVYVTVMNLVAFVILTCISAYILLYVPISNSVLAKKSFLIFDIVWAIGSAILLVWVALNQFKVRQKAKEFMQDLASRTWAPLEPPNSAQ